MKIKVINIFILIVTLVGTFLVLSFLPDVVPVHFNIHGIADRWGSKYELLTMPGCMAAMIATWFVCDRGFSKKLKGEISDKERAEVLANIKVINITFTVISIMFFCINFAIMYMSYSQLETTPEAKVDIMKIVTAIMGLSFILMGNIMPKTRNNPTIGFRLPWTRFNDATWQRCNRLGGIIMVICGILTVIAGLVFSGMTSIIIMLLITVLSMIILTIYAYGVCKQEKK